MDSKQLDQLVNIFPCFKREEIIDMDMIADDAEKKLQEMLPTCNIHAKIELGLGLIFKVRTYYKNTEVTPLNAANHLLFMVHLTNGSGESTIDNGIQIELVNRSYKLKEKGLRFRKIKGKTFQEAVNKLVKWYEKNRDFLK